MSCMNDNFVLEKEIPNQLICFTVPKNEIQKSLGKNETIEINYKRLYRRLTGRKRKVANEMKDPMSPVPENPEGAKKQSNIFETFLDRLERKYLALANIPSTVETVIGSEGEDSNSNFSNSTQGSPEPVEKEVKSKKSKKKVSSIQDYDYNDPFIDDSEVVNELEEALNRKKLKTKHDGFFVSSGELEVVKVKKTVAPKTQSSTNAPSVSSPQAATQPLKESDKPQKTNKTSAANAQPPAPTAESSKTTKSAKATAAVPAPIETAVPSSSSIQEAITSPGDIQPDDYFLEESNLPPGQNPEQKKEKPPKPAWDPTPEIIEALEKFKQFMEDNQAKPRKSALFPTILETPLLQLDELVKKSFSSEQLNKTSGYYEYLINLFGKSNWSAGKIKSLILKIIEQQKANLLRQRLFQDLIPKLITDLRNTIKECPPDKQPGNKKPRKSLTSSNGMEGSEPMDLTNDGAPVESSAMIEEGEAPVPTTEQENPAGGNEQQQQSISKPAIEYKWYCQWSIPLRHQVVEIENHLNDWVTAENIAREKISQADRKFMTANEYTPLQPALELAIIFQKIAEEAFPPLCLHGDITAIRNALRTEKRRLNPKPPKASTTPTPQPPNAKAAIPSTTPVNNETLVDK